MGNKATTSATSIHAGSICAHNIAPKQKTPEELNKKYIDWLYDKHKTELPTMSRINGIKFLINCLTFVPIKPTFYKTYIVRSIVQEVNVDYKYKWCSVCEETYEHSCFTNRKNKKLLKLSIFPYTWYSVCNNCEFYLQSTLITPNGIMTCITRAKADRSLYISTAIKKRLGEDISMIVTSFLI